MKWLFGLIKAQTITIGGIELKGSFWSNLMIKAWKSGWSSKNVMFR